MDELNSNIITIQSKHDTIKKLDEKILELLSDDEEMADELNANTEFELKVQNYVRDEAQQAIQGLPLSGENYDKAWQLLTERYGNSQLIRSSLMNKLIKLEKPSNGSAKELRKLYDTVESNVRALKSTGIEKETLGPMLIPIVLEKLPNVVRLHLSRTLGSNTWDITEFLKAINEEILARENFDYLKGPEAENSNSKKRSSMNFGGAQQRKKFCRFCQSTDHYSDQCTIVTTNSARREILKKNHCCFNCLKPGHSKKECKTTIKCYKCGTSGNHPTALCQQTNTKGEKTDEKSEEKNDETLSLTELQTAVIIEKSQNLVDDSGTVLLQTANGIAESDNKARGVRVLFDSGAQQTYITEKVVKDLNLSPIRKVNMCVKTFGSSKEKISSVKEYELSLKGDSTVKIKAFAVPTICAPVSGQDIGTVLEEFPHLKQYTLAENDKTVEKSIDVLIGGDYYWELMTGDVKKDKSGLTLLKSLFGYVLSGPMKFPESSTNVVSTHVMKIVCETREDKLLSEEVKNFWDLETIGIKENERSVYDKFNDEIDFAEGRFVVKLPFKDSQSSLPDHYLLSKKRLDSLHNRIGKNPELFEQYSAVFDDQLSKGVIEPVPEDDPGEPGMVTYLPHREVVRPDKITTKVRVVFDASAKYRDGVSLNDVLYKGPCLNPLLFDSLLNFRSHPIAMCADIEKAYTQIEIDPAHRDFMRFLWYKNPYAKFPEIQTFRFTRIIWGVTSSQFLLNGCVRKVAKKYEQLDPEFSRKVRDHFYVDDLNTGTSSVENGLDLYKKFKLRFMEASFPLRKWRTNSQELRENINEKEEKEINKKNEINKKEKVEYKNEDLQNSKVLGIVWNELDDKLILSVKGLFENVKEEMPTKREILKIIAGIYDPIGFVQPLTIGLKLLFREICLLNVGWDETLPNEICTKWLKVVQSFMNVPAIVVNRYYFTGCSINDPIEKIYLHGFSDAADLAYGCCVYIKGVTKCENVIINFVTSKSRVSFH
ncbi:uncharacterized protein [Clytia hemisphaerica]|uniref:uncharacterized protein n=1 Tax=Clytia hemisphaerica TaxID=252671 RepID=UPI0034D6DCB8